MKRFKHCLASGKRPMHYAKIGVLLCLCLPTIAFPNASISHLDAYLSILNQNALDDSVAVEPTLGLVPGAIFGQPTETVFPISGADVTRISFPLMYLLGAVNTLVTAVSDSSLQVEPPQTRFGRISTGGVVFGSDVYSIGGGFRDRADELDLVLIYVEGPCRITGNIQTKDEKFRVDLSFDSSGFYWVSIDGSGTVSHADIDEPVLFQLFGEPPSNG